MIKNELVTACRGHGRQAEKQKAGKKYLK